MSVKTHILLDLSRLDKEFVCPVWCGDNFAFLSAVWMPTEWSCVRTILFIPCDMKINRNFAV